jgi:hypothetical protein
MALVAAARGSARSAAKKAARSLSSGADVLAGSGYVKKTSEDVGFCLASAACWNTEISVFINLTFRGVALFSCSNECIQLKSNKRIPPEIGI